MDSLNKLMAMNGIKSLKKPKEEPKNIIEAENGDKFEVIIDAFGNVTTKTATSERGMLL